MTRPRQLRTRFRSGRAPRKRARSGFSPGRSSPWSESGPPGSGRGFHAEGPDPPWMAYRIRGGSGDRQAETPTGGVTTLATSGHHSYPRNRKRPSGQNRTYQPAYRGSSWLTTATGKSFTPAGRSTGTRETGGPLGNGPLTEEHKNHGCVEVVVAGARDALANELIRQDTLTAVAD